MKFIFDIDGLNHYREVELELCESKKLTFPIEDTQKEVTATFKTICKICNPIVGSTTRLAVLRLDYKGGRHVEHLFKIK